ncbi:hypothetical protein DXG03_000971, partial [Asterophora parasitica]
LPYTFQDEKKSEEKKEETPKAPDDVSNKNKPYPDVGWDTVFEMIIDLLQVKEPTKSELQKKKDAIDKEKKDKISKGQYQVL